MKKSYKAIAIVGFISKGIIYLIIGFLSLLAALQMGGKSSGTSQALSFLKSQPFGRIMLLLLGLGLLCYSAWMFLQSIKDPENRGSEKNAKLRRFSLFTTGIVYTAVAVMAFYHLFTSSYKGDSQTKYMSFIDPSVLSFIFICVGVVLLLQGIVLIIGAFKGGLLDQFNLEGQKHYQIIRSVGRFGFYARAFVVIIIAYFFLRAGIYTGNHDIKGMQDAFAFMEQTTSGRILMAITAIGFISYGAFFIFLTRFRSFKEE
ncbi:MAG: DUF1206 domain-containing protein [Psychroflexus halocasei]